MNKDTASKSTRNSQSLHGVRMSKFRPPEPLIFEGNLADQWDRWKQQFEIYLIATESTEKAEKIKTSILLTCIGKQGLDIYNTFTFCEDDDKMKLKPVMDQFEAYCKPRKNITLLRARSHQRGCPYVVGLSLLFSFPWGTQNKRVSPTT